MTVVRIRIGERVEEVPPDTRVVDVLDPELVQREGIVAATLNHHVVSLDARLGADTEIIPISRREPLGAQTVHRSVTHMLQAVALERLPQHRLIVGQSIGEAYFYEVDGGPADLERVAQSLTEGLASMSDANQPFIKRLVPLETAMSLLNDPTGEKRLLLRTWATPLVPLVELGSFIDIQHGPFLTTTSAATGARVTAYPPGILLHFPEVPNEVDASKVRVLWKTYEETRDWNRRVGIDTIGELNHATLEDNIGQVIRVAEALHEKKIARIADDIAGHRDQVRVICVSGPSSAGKTTFVRRTSIQLQVNGIKPVLLGLDDYYLPRDECPRDDDGDFDFEALEALDVPLINEHLRRLLAGQEIRVPSFDFVNGRRYPESQWHPMKLGPGEVVLIEGIHGLNPALTESIADNAAFRIYINALSELFVDEHTRMYTVDGRLIRRIVRDRRYRGTSAADTLARWPSVRRGEMRHIFPFEGKADVVFNSALIFELAVLKTFAWRYLLEVPLDHPTRIEAYRLLKLLELFVPVFPDEVPANSVLREFIGGSVFSY